MERLTKIILLLSFFLLSTVYTFFLPTFAFGRQEWVAEARFQPNQVLVRYTDEAERVIFAPSSQSRSFSNEKKSIFYYLRKLFSNNQTAKQIDELQQIETIYSQLVSRLGVYKQVSLERQASFSRTIKFEKAKITPATSPMGNDPLTNVYLVSFSQGTVEGAIEAFKESGLVTQAQPNYLYQASNQPNDSRYSEMWAHQKIFSPQAWDISTGSQQVVVAVVDTGVDYNHPDLADNIWTGTVNGQTVHGWDFGDNNGDPNDSSGHGSHVAGIIGAVGDNNTGVVGINWQVKIMAVDVFVGEDAPSFTIVQGIRFAVDHGAKVVNLSLGGTDPECGQVAYVENQTISWATQQGTLVVAAAGNEGVNAACFWPANHPDVLAVSATGPDDEPAVYSNYGLASWKNTKMVAAPGGSTPTDRNNDGHLGSGDCVVDECILSTWKSGGYNDIEGTSMAAPHVTGLAALVLSKYNLTPLQLRQHLVNTADEIPNSDFSISEPNPNIPSDNGQRSFGKRINAYQALSDQSGGTIPTATPAGPTPTLNPNAPSPTPGGEASGEIDIWTTALIDGSEVAAPMGSFLPKGTLVSICYSRAAGVNTLTIDRGGGMVTVLQKNFEEPNPNGCLFAVSSSGTTRFLPLGELASQEGSPHVYTLNSGGQTVSTTVNVTLGETDIPTGPSPTSMPTATPSGPTATPDPNATATPTPAGSDIGQLINQVSEEKIREYLYHLVDDDEESQPLPDNLQTRYSTLDGNRMEAEYIKSHFDSLGLETQFQSVSPNLGRNIIAKIEGTNPNEVYLVTAHMDSTSSDSDKDPAPGADDNGSGTAVVMEIARVLKGIASQLDASIEFVLFSGEEQGLYGSYDYVASIPAGKLIKGVINLDMVGFGPSTDCVIFAYKEKNREKFLVDKIVSINSQYSIGLGVETGRSDMAASDHASFWANNNPAIFGIECDFNDYHYHTTHDKTDYVNFNQITKVAKAVSGALVSLARK